MAKIEERPGKVSFGKAWKDFFVGYVDFKGRSTRAGYWWVKIFTTILGIVGIFMILNPIIQILLANNGNAPEEVVVEALVKALVPAIVFLLVALVFFIPNITLTVRRMRDVGIRGRGQATLVVLYIIISFLALPDFTRIGEADFEVTGSSIEALWGLGVFILSLLPTGTLATSKETGILAFFFKNKKFYEDSAL